MRSLKHTSEPLKVILLAEPNDERRLTAKWFLSEFGFAVDCARSAEEGLSVFDPEIHNVVVLGDSMSGMSGREMAHVIKLRSPSTPILLYGERPPNERSCLDLVLQWPTHLLALKGAIDTLVSRRAEAHGSSTGQQTTGPL